MRTQTLATIVLPFEHLDHFVQIGDDITETTPLFLLAIGRKLGETKMSIVIEKLECVTKDASTCDIAISEVHCEDLVNMVESIKSVFSTSNTLVVEKDGQIEILKLLIN